MPGRVLLVHGWSATAASMRSVRTFLEGKKFDVADVWLSDYISLDDDVRVEDVAKRMNAVLQAEAARLKAPFDLIVHSTGGLVAREWLTRYYPDGKGCPVKRIVMLAPANFGSRLAATGKSFIGRVVKGWNNWFESGEEMLRGLELASAYQWRLAQRDLVSPDGGIGPYGDGKVWPFVIIGSRGHTGGLAKVTNEDGADGVVRACAANLNAVGLTLDFSKRAGDPEVSLWKPKQAMGDLAFALLPDRNHSTIVEPGTDVGTTMSGRLGELILEALSCTSDDQYRQISAQWARLTEATAQLADNAAARKAMFSRDEPAASAFHQFYQTVVRVSDDHGQPVKDYFLEFFSPEVGGAEDTVVFQREVLKHVHPNTMDQSYRCLFADRSSLMSSYYKGGRKSVAMSISAATIGDNIRYFDSTKAGASGKVVVHNRDDVIRSALEARLVRNRTHLVEIVIPRQPIDKVFRLS